MSQHPMSADLRKRNEAAIKVSPEIGETVFVAIADELDRMQTIVNRLPLTADKIPVSGGESVWIPENYEPQLRIHKQVGPIKAFVYWEDEYEGKGEWYVRVPCLKGVHEGDCCIPVEVCYSTQELAESACK